MIIGIGTDIIEISRIENAVERTKSFLTKAFTQNELKLFESRSMRPEVIAGNFAAKEAISKAIGTGFRGCSLRDIEVLRDELGKPIVKLSSKIDKLISAERYKLNISISHNQTTAIAFAILEEM